MIFLLSKGHWKVLNIFVFSVCYFKLLTRQKSVRSKACKFWGASPWENLLNRGETIKVTKNQTGRNKMSL